MIKNLIVSFFLAFGCAKAPSAISPQDFVSERPSISLIGKYGMGHACAVNGKILTASHVAAPMKNGKEAPQWYTWSDVVRGGWMKFKMASSARDLAMMESDIGDTPRYHKLALNAIAGEKVYWYQYNYGHKKVLQVSKREAIIERTIAGHIVTSNPPIKGASGGCLFNEAAEVVGIITWAFTHGGVAVNLTGQWWPF